MEAVAGFSSASTRHNERGYALSKQRITQQQNGLARAVMTFAIMALLVACATPPPSQPVAEPIATSEEAVSDCVASENLIQDPAFTRSEAYRGVWRMTQHAGETSFAVTVNEGTVQMARISSQPWMLFFQDIQDERLRGATLRYSAELKADLPAEPMIHGFEHKGGLYTQVGRQRGSLAEHEPNHGTWDWQTFTTDLTVGPRDNKIRLGFNHQAGGTLWARNPSLVIIDCE